jgi:hypothetical protein
MNEKSAERNQLIYEFGILMQPLEDLLAADPPQTAEAYRIAIAKVQSGDASWRKSVRQLATFAQDVFFNAEFQDISHVAERCLREVGKFINDPVVSADARRLQMRLAPILKTARKEFFDGLDRVPVQWEPVVFEANTPFTSYLRIKEATAGVRRRFRYSDRYLKPEFFELFLASLIERSVLGCHLENKGLLPDDPSIEIRLVTTRRGVSDVRTVATLAEQEFNDFRLIEVSPSDMHDRNLRVDDRIFSLGPGVDRAGFALTNFGLTDSSAVAHEQFDRLIQNGTVVI